MDNQLSPKQLMQSLGEKVKQYRWEKRLTLDQMALKAKVSTVLLSQIEKNELDNTSLKKMVDIAEAIECELQILLLDKELPVSLQ